MKTLIYFLIFFNFKVYDAPYDAGGAIIIEWEWPEEKKGEKCDSVTIWRSTSREGEFEKIKTLVTILNSYKDTGLENGKEYFYKITLYYKDKIFESEDILSAIPKVQYFHIGRLNIMIGIFLFLTFILFFIQRAKKGISLFLRKIPGLDAVEEAVGRSTEMGRPILYIPGLSTISDVATIASLNILSQVVKKAAEYETNIIIPNRDPVVYLIAREVVKEAYTMAGRPDLFNADSVYYVTDSQFGYASAVCGIMVREKPATNFFLGMFWAESLILAETGATTGAIQIAGTDAVTQLPFFITACDYTLIGEELYAASAYLSREPVLVSTIRAQDMMKAIIWIIIFLGGILSFFGKRPFEFIFGGG